jgi:hypothetical protein
VSVSPLDKDNDWVFGRAGYKRGSDEVRQNVITRIRCFTADWFLDVTDGIDWYALLGQKNTQQQIISAVEKRILETVGVLSIEQLQVVESTSEAERKERKLTLNIRFKTIYDDVINEELSVTP